MSYNKLNMVTNNLNCLTFFNNLNYKIFLTIFLNNYDKFSRNTSLMDLHGFLLLSRTKAKGLMLTLLTLKLAVREELYAYSRSSLDLKNCNLERCICNPKKVKLHHPKKVIGGMCVIFVVWQGAKLFMWKGGTVVNTWNHLGQAGFCLPP